MHCVSMAVFKGLFTKYQGTFGPCSCASKIVKTGILMSILASCHQKKIKQERGGVEALGGKRQRGVRVGVWLMVAQ